MRFLNIHSVAKRLKMKGGLKNELFMDFFAEKSRNAEQKLKGGHFSLARYCMLRGKKEKLFWFSSLGQMVQFDTIKFLRTISVSSCGLKKVTIIVAFHFMMRRLKTNA